MLGGASGANTGHFASFFYYTRERALLEGELAAQARKIKEKKKKVKFSGEKNKELKEKTSLIFRREKSTQDGLLVNQLCQDWTQVLWKVDCSI